MREKTHLDQQIAAITELETQLQDQMDLIQLAEEENDTELVDEANAELARLAKSLAKNSLKACCLAKQTRIIVSLKFIQEPGYRSPRLGCNAVENVFQWAEARGLS